MKKVLESILDELVICCLDYSTCLAINNIGQTLSRLISSDLSSKSEYSSVTEAAGKMNLLVSIIEKSDLEAQDAEKVKRTAGRIAFENKRNHDGLNKVVKRLRDKANKSNTT